MYRGGPPQAARANLDRPRLPGYNAASAVKTRSRPLPGKPCMALRRELRRPAVGIVTGGIIIGGIMTGGIMTGWLCAAPLAAAPPAAPVLEPAATQVVFVVTADWAATRGTLAAFERDAAGAWRQRGESHPVMVGRHGSAWGRGQHPPVGDGPQKREGDGRSPAGVFTIGPAFGSAAGCETGLDYLALSIDDWCIDVADSPLYNRIVSTREVGAAAVAGSTEPMRRDLHLDGDGAYALGFVIGHNCDCRPGAGSCIFAHLHGDPPGPTAGCTAMTEGQLAALLGWLRADAQPRFVLLPAAEAAARAAAWGLPAPPEPPRP